MKTPTRFPLPSPLVSLVTLLLACSGGANGCAPSLDNKNGEEIAVPDGDATGETAEVTCEGEPQCFKTQGICKDQVIEAQCIGDQWVCTYEGYVEEDETCDGLDSDCDGIPDEEEPPALALEGCGKSALGVCKDVKVTCKNNEYACDYAALVDELGRPLYVADNGEGLVDGDPWRWCDGLDNDCDGWVDGTPPPGQEGSEPEDFIFAQPGMSWSDFLELPWKECPDLVGVCGGKLSGADYANGSAGEYSGALYMRCFNGTPVCAWECPDGAGEDCNVEEKVAEKGFELEEISCDGLDNDCDGIVDDVYDVTASDCPHVSVCSGKVEAICKNLEEDPEEDPIPGWVCIYDAALLTDPAFEYQDLAACEGQPGCGAETLCDNIDNDCDGLVDEGLTWPFHCFSQAIDGTVSYDCEDPDCAQFHPMCAESTPLEFANCPVTEKTEVAGVANVVVPALDADGLPVLPGVCGPYTGGDAGIRMSCVPRDVDEDETPDANFWMCNYELVESYNATEAANDAEWCDGLDNDCDGLVDGDLKPNGAEVEITANKVSPHVPCRNLGACQGQWTATCNKDFKAPGKWFCEYTGAEIEKNPDCDSAFGSCIWEETLCDGVDNDCDGIVDELLDGMKVNIDEVCIAKLGIGVCTEAALNTACADTGDGTKGFVCDYSGVAAYAPVEEGATKEFAENCDGLDNDCDGEVDEDIAFFSPSLHQEFATGCLYKGVCGQGSKAVCSPADPPVEGLPVWECDYSDLGEAYTEGAVVLGGQLTEVFCDGLDNDCDGLVDEGLSLDLANAGAKNPKLLSGCPLLGICSGVMKWGCEVVEGSAQWVCDSSAVGGYEKIEESCDGFDNDCDAKVDEDLHDIGPEGANCKSLGVCGLGGVTAECVQQEGVATYLCHYDEVPGYDGLVETTCDGDDNDCDGFIDEDLNWEAVNACNKTGVCNSPLLDADCQGEEGWNCIYGLIDEWEPEETLCDQLDNDCDGFTDEAACDICDPCQDNLNCLSGACNLVPSETGLLDKYCSYQKSWCVYINPYSGACDFVNTQQAACATKNTAVVCGSGTWFPKATCSGATPYCYQGNCKVCVPGNKSCDGNTVKVCATSGDMWNTEKICGEGTICVGTGKCVQNSEFKISTQSLSDTQVIDINPKVAARANGGFATVYHARAFTGGNQTDVLFRLYTDAIAPVGVAETIVNPVVSGSQEEPDIAPIPNDDGGFVVVWQDTNRPAGVEGEGTEIMARLISDSGLFLGDRFLVNTTTMGNQIQPSVAAFSNGTFLVAWEHDDNGEDEPEVYGQAYKADGTKYGEEFQVNTTTPGPQSMPALGWLPATGYLAAWTSQGQVDSQDVFYQVIDKNFEDVGSEKLANAQTSSVQARPAVAGFSGVKAGGFVIAWESMNIDQGSLGVGMNTFDKNGNAIYGADILVNKAVQSGSQRDVAVTVLDDNSIVVAWETQGLAPDLDLEGVAAKVFDANGIEMTVDEFLVNQSTAGRQNNAEVCPIPGRGYVVVWFSQPGAAQYHVYGRVFKVD